MTVDILYVAWERLEFTKRTFRFLTENTNWGKVRSLVVYDDGSGAAARTWLDQACRDFDAAPVVFRQGTRYGSPVAIMANYLKDTPADWFVKLDNDVAVPEGWLDAMLGVIDRNPELDLLGMEAGMTVLPYPRKGSVHYPDFDGNHVVEDCSHIGGVGLMRTAAFHRGHKLAASGRYYGFTEWQTRCPLPLNRGWIKPDLACPLLDRIPVEPFASLSAMYTQNGWQRHWNAWPPAMEWAFGWVTEKEAQCATA